MKALSTPRSSAMSDVAIVIASTSLAGLALVGGGLTTGGLLAAAALTVGTYVGMRHPLWLYWMLAFTLGAIPFGYFPGVHVPLTSALTLGALLATLLHRSTNVELHGPTKVVLLLTLASTLSLVATATSVTDLAEFLKWCFATLVFVALMRLSESQLTQFGRIYVYASGLSAAFGILIVFGDPSGKLINLLSIVGYGREKNSTRYVYSSSGNSVRLAGTYIDPNAAGIGLLVALVVCLLLFTGWRRVSLASLLMVALTLTLSRAALFSVLTGVVLLLLFHGLRARQRRLILGTVGLAILAAVATPPVRSRVLSSFGSDDAGSSARADALRDFTKNMSGHWIFGLGWGRPEFKDPATSFQVNFVANAPLLTIYRGGVITGLIFAVLLVMCCVMAYRLLRGRDVGAAALGGLFIGLCVVALQLDYPIVTTPSVTMMFSVFLAFLCHADRKRLDELGARADGHVPELTTT